MRRIFFIWLDPGAPLQAATTSSKPMPDKYATNVARWRQRYGDDVVDVLDGAACLAAVQGVEAKGHCPGLTAQYNSFAHRGSWIRCADIARVAHVYLHGGVYLDTDMYVGPPPSSNETLRTSTVAIPWWPPQLVLISQNGASALHTVSMRVCNGWG